MQEHRSGCILCGEELVYRDGTVKVECSYCKNEFESDVMCRHGHFICDSCHSTGANDLIEIYCLESDSTEPLAMALELMKHPALKIHGPEHHYLVPAVLISAFYNLKRRDMMLGETRNVKRKTFETLDNVDTIDSIDTIDDIKKRSLTKARGRAENVLGGFCGLYGDCGAAVGTGIFISIITGATPLTRESWRLSNLMTARSLHTIAMHGGPRCCKRNTYLAITEAVDYLQEFSGIQLDIYRSIKCEFNSLNKECLEDECQYYGSG